MSLAEVQCHLDKEGASDLVIDLIMNTTSDRVFQESILLAIALLEGGNTTIQVGRSVCVCTQSPAVAEIFTLLYLSKSKSMGTCARQNTLVKVKIIIQLLYSNTTQKVQLLKCTGVKRENVGCFLELIKQCICWLKSRYSKLTSL